MAATRLVSGVLREIWREAVLTPGGPPLILQTRIRLTDRHRSRVQGLMVIDSAVGQVQPSATIEVEPTTGRLSVRINQVDINASMTWTLDVMLVHSIQQAVDPTPFIDIPVVFGVGAAAQTLAQTYDIGSVPADQRMVIDTVTGGVVIEASTPAVTADGPAFSVRQHGTWATPVLVDRAADSFAGATLQFRKARGTLAAPVQVAQNDNIGVIDFYAYTAGAYGLPSRIFCWVNTVAAGPGFELSTTLDFEASGAGVRASVFRMSKNGAPGGGILTGINDPLIVPDVAFTGQLGSVTAPWGVLQVQDAYVYRNIRMDATVANGGADLTLIFPNTSTMPVPQANQIYIGSRDFTPDGGVNNAAALTISAEALAVAVSDVATHFIPLVYNGVNYYLLARDMTGA